MLGALVVFLTVIFFTNFVELAVKSSKGDDLFAISQD
jgi:hypothetical protein